jgi:hypothetical protein
MVLVGVKRGSGVEFAVPPSWRARWLHAGGRIVREEAGEIMEPIALADFRASLSASAPVSSSSAPAGAAPSVPAGDSSQEVRRDVRRRAR